MILLRFSKHQNLIGFSTIMAVWLAAIAKSLNIASVHYSITPAWNI